MAVTTEFWLEVQKHFGVSPKQMNDYVTNGISSALPRNFPFYSDYIFMESPFCCGVGEVGRLVNLPDIKKKVVEAILAAFSHRKGLLHYYCFVGSEAERIWREIQPLGFVKSHEFYNPNSKHRVVEFTLELGPIGNYV